MPTPTVYLAGPITGLTFDESVDWRESAAAELADAGIQAFSPLRCKDYLRGYGRLEDQYEGVHPLSNAKGITTRDRWDVQTKDAILVNFLGATRVSIGTCIELGWADAARKPVVVAMEESNVHWHAMVTEIAGYIVPTLEEALFILKAVLRP